MSDTVKIILTGKIRTDYERAEVVAALTKMLKIGEDEADALLAGRETVLKQDVPAGVASRHVQILREIGAKVRVEAMPVAAPVEPALPGMGSNPNPAPKTDSRPAASRPSARQLELVPMAEPEPPADPDPLPYSGFGRTGPAGTRMMTAETPSLFGLSLNGRIGRLRYLVYGWLGIFLIAFAATTMLMLTGFSLYKLSTASAPSGAWLAGAAAIGILVLWLSIRVSVLRLHDINLSGKWLLAIWILPALVAGIMRSPGLMAFAEILSWLTVVVLLLWPGSAVENDYGNPPGANTLLIYLGTVLIILLGALAIRGYSHHELPLGRNAVKINSAGVQTMGRPVRVE